MVTPKTIAKPIPTENATDIPTIAIADTNKIFATLKSTPPRRAFVELS